MSSAKGMRAEQLAAEFLVEQGAQILHSNYRCRLGEIDLIAKLPEKAELDALGAKDFLPDGIPDEAPVEPDPRVFVDE